MGRSSRGAVVGALVVTMLACGGSEPGPVAPDPIPSRVRAPTPAPRRHAERKARKSKGKARTRATDPIDWVAGELATESPCRPQEPLCKVLAGIREMPQQHRGSRIGFALPCVDDDGARSPELTGALRGDLADVELAGLAFEGDRFAVFALNPESEAEREMIDDARRQLLDCLARPEGDCVLQLDPPLVAALDHPRGHDAAARRDARGHVTGSGDPLDWHVGHSPTGSEGWLVVNEHDTGHVACNWLDVFPNTAPRAR